jgi:hypothetical protein
MKGNEGTTKGNEGERRGKRRERRGTDHDKFLAELEMSLVGLS